MRLMFRTKKVLLAKKIDPHLKCDLIPNALEKFVFRLRQSLGVRRSHIGPNPIFQVRSVYFKEACMIHAEVMKVAGENFKDEINKGVVLVDFFADWCGPCRMLAPVLEKVAKEVAGQATLVKLDIDQCQEIASEYHITSVPTLILFKAGKEVGRVVGLRDAAQLKEFILSAK